MNAYQPPTTAYPTPSLLGWQRGVLTTISIAITHWIGAHHARGAAFGVRQPGCRSSRGHDPARVALLIIPVRGMLCLPVTISNE
ncbi:hypothetical protein [Chloroflexus sp.]|uniref:hypothetical protein n=1 Tax=Chloroflexus sp. TaxID=1904827 RepID=UPI002ADE0A8A|nr:hypothetical protein [Chloroflexus sp.]